LTNAEEFAWLGLGLKTRGVNMDTLLCFISVALIGPIALCLAGAIPILLSAWDDNKDLLGRGDVYVHGRYERFGGSFSRDIATGFFVTALCGFLITGFLALSCLSN
jgi:hypothetical protein